MGGERTGNKGLHLWGLCRIERDWRLRSSAWWRGCARGTDIWTAACTQHRRRPTDSLMDEFGEPRDAGQDQPVPCVELKARLLIDAVYAPVRTESTGWLCPVTPGLPRTAVLALRLMLVMGITCG